MGYVRLVSICWLLVASGCGRIFGLDDAYPLADSHQSNSSCSQQGLTCAGTVTMMTCSNGCWVSCTEPVSESTAASRCSSWTGSLAPLKSSFDQTCLRQTIVPSGDVWIGLEQGAGASSVSSRWSWNGDGLSLNYTNWASNQPDDADNVENGTEQCAMIASGTSNWSDTSCAMTLPFACRRVFDN